jgi:hypothetical protein
MAIDLESGHSYRVLQVDPHADLTVIRAAYRPVLVPASLSSVV